MRRFVLLSLFVTVACGGLEPEVDPSCIVPSSLLYDDGIAKDAIPALTDPELVAPEDEAADYVTDLDRVIGLWVGDRAIAVPHLLLNWHEVVNFNFEGVALAVTYCPLTGSGLVFDRAAIDGGEFGVTGFLFHSNLVMYDRTTRESLWPQMQRGAVCGDRAGQRLALYPSVDIRLGEWRRLHPNTLVVSRLTGHVRNYSTNQYELYQRPRDTRVGGGDVPIDPRRLPKERVLGIAFDDDAGVAFPYFALDSLGVVAAVNQTIGGAPIVVSWSRVAGTAVAFVATHGGRRLTFEVVDGQYRDVETGTTWTLDGDATAGPLAGGRLEQVDASFTAFWFAWAAFQPTTGVWTKDPP